MKKITIWISLIFFVFGMSALNAKRSKIDKIKYPPLNKIVKPVIDKDITNNGIKLRLIKTTRFPIITLRAYFKGGDVYDPSDKTGLASMTASLMRIGGAGEYSSEKLDTVLDSKGISISIYSNDDYYVVSLSSLKENFKESLKILSLILQKPLFNKDKFDELKTRLASSISRRNDDPASIAAREFEKIIYGSKSAFASQLEYEKIDNIKIKDIKETFERFFKPSNAVFGITGPISIKEFKSDIEEYFGKWSGNAVIPDYPKVLNIDNKFQIGFAQKDNLNQSYINLGHIGYIENIDEKAAIMVFNSIFSQGFNSRLMQRLRVKMGLTYGIGGGIMNSYLHPGKVFFSTFTKSESTIDVLKAINDEIEKIRREKVSKTELEDAKNYFLNSYVFKFSSPEKILYDYMKKEFYGLDVKKYDRLMENIKKVSVDDVLKVAKKYLKPNKIVAMVVGNKKKIKGDLSQLGKVKNIDISIKQPVLKEKIPAATEQTLEMGKKIVFNALNKCYRGYKNIRSLRILSNVELKMMGRNFSVETDSYTQYPDRSYTLTKVMGMKIERIIDGNKGVMKQMGQSKPISSKEIKKGDFASIYDIYKNYKKYKFQFLKTEKIGNSVYDIIYIFTSGDNWVKFFINRKSHLIEFKEKIDNIAGEKGVARIVNSQFKKIGNIYFAFKTDILLKGKKKVGITVKKIEINPKINSDMFKMD